MLHQGSLKKLPCSRLKRYDSLAMGHEPGVVAAKQFQEQKRRSYRLLLLDPTSHEPMHHLQDDGRLDPGQEEQAAEQKQQIYR